MADLEQRRQQYWEGQRQKASKADPDSLKLALQILSVLPLSEENKAAGADWLASHHKMGVVPENQPVIGDAALQAGLAASSLFPPLGIPANMAYEADRMEQQTKAGIAASAVPLLLSMLGGGGASKFSAPERLAARDVAVEALGAAPSLERKMGGAAVGTVPGGIIGYQAADATIDPSQAETDEAGTTRAVGTIGGALLGVPAGIKGSHILHDRKLGQMGERLMGLSDVTVPEQNAYVTALEQRLLQAESAAGSRQAIAGRLANLENQTTDPAGSMPGGPLLSPQQSPRTARSTPSSEPPIDPSTIGGIPRPRQMSHADMLKARAEMERTVDEGMKVSTVQDAAYGSPRAVAEELAGGNPNKADLYEVQVKDWLDENGPVLEAGGWRDPKTGRWTSGPPGARGRLQPTAPSKPKGAK